MNHKLTTVPTQRLKVRRPRFCPHVTDDEQREHLAEHKLTCARCYFEACAEITVNPTAPKRKESA